VVAIHALPPQGVLAQLAIDLTERSLCKTLDALRNAAHVCSTAAAAAAAAADAGAERNYAAATPQQQDAALQAAEAAMNHTLQLLAVAQALPAAAAKLEDNNGAAACSFQWLQQRSPIAFGLNCCAPPPLHAGLTAAAAERDCEGEVTSSLRLLPVDAAY
jgi:hypothetical protein